MNEKRNAIPGWFVGTRTRAEELDFFVRFVPNKPNNRDFLDPCAFNGGFLKNDICLEIGSASVIFI
jgi:hypothetical protein